MFLLNDILIENNFVDHMLSIFFYYMLFWLYAEYF